MSQLEMVFLMKVSLHLNTMNDVIEFEKINKKCSTTIHSLKVNPWFNNGKDIEKFNKIFEPTTCNCNGFEIDNIILLKAARIRNYSFGSRYPGSLCLFDFFQKPEKKQQFISIISKVESIKTDKIGNDEEFELLVQNMKPNLKIECENNFFIQFENAFRKLQVEMNFYPKQVIINIKERDVNNKFFNLLQESNQDNIICFWKGNHSVSEIKNKITSSKVKNYISNFDFELFEKKNVVLMVGDENEKRSHESVEIFKEKRRGGVNVLMEDIVTEEKRMKCFDLINKVYAKKINFYYETEGLLFDKENIKLPECVKEIFIGLKKKSFFVIEHGKFKLPFSLERIEVLNHNGIFEINEKNVLKVLKLSRVDRINYIGKEKEKVVNLKLEWTIENKIDYFSKLTKLYLNYCQNIEIISKLKNLEYLDLHDCESCHINIDSKNLKDIYLNCNKSEIKLKIFRNDIKLIISKCSSVNIKIDCEGGIKPNIEITNCKKSKIKSNNEIGNIVIEESKDISFNDLKCKLIQLNNSETTDGLIEAKVVRLINVTKTCPINLNKAHEIVIVNVNNYIFINKFESCKKLIIYECNDCDFDLGNNQIVEMKVLKCKSTNIEGTLPNIKSFVSIENNDCKLPITNNIITTDEEIIELKENTKIVTDKKHLIIRNGKDVECEIESLIKSDITFENCRNIDLKLKNKLIGVLKFNNCEVLYNEISFLGKPMLNVGCVDSLIVNNSKNLQIEVKNVDNLLKIKDSDLYLIRGRVMSSDLCNENYNNPYSREISSNKCVIINSKINLDVIVIGCREELVLKGMEGDRFEIDERVKKITLEDCCNFQFMGDLKGREVKLIRCSVMKLNDTSNSIQMESCQNVEVDAKEQQINNQPFGFFPERKKIIVHPLHISLSNIPFLPFL